MGVFLHAQEWKSAGRATRRLAAAGIAVLILSTIVFGIGNWIAIHAPPETEQGQVPASVAASSDVCVLKTNSGLSRFS